MTKLVIGFFLLTAGFFLMELRIEYELHEISAKIDQLYEDAGDQPEAK